MGQATAEIALSVVAPAHNERDNVVTLVEQIEKQEEPLADQIAFARPYLLEPLEAEDLDAFSRVAIDAAPWRAAAPGPAGGTAGA